MANTDQQDILAKQHIEARCIKKLKSGQGELSRERGSEIILNLLVARFNAREEMGMGADGQIGIM